MLHTYTYKYDGVIRNVNLNCSFGLKSAGGDMDDMFHIHRGYGSCETQMA